LDEQLFGADGHVIIELFLVGNFGHPSNLAFGSGSIFATYDIIGNAGLPSLLEFGAGIVSCSYLIIGSRGLPSGQRFGQGGIVRGTDIQILEIVQPWWVNEETVVFQPQDPNPGMTARYFASQRVYLGGSWTSIAPWRMPRIAPADGDRILTVTVGEEGRLDILAMNIYKSSALWWVIALANNIQNPFEEPRAGDRIRIPSIQRIYRSILGAQASGEELYVERPTEV
jgi:hypothetical protein